MEQNVQNPTKGKSTSANTEGAIDRPYGKRVKIKYLVVELKT